MVSKVLASLTNYQPSKPAMTMTLTAAMREGKWYGFGPDVQIPLYIKGLEPGTRYTVVIRDGAGRELVS